MNTRAIALTCALTAASCGGSEPRPAQDPSWVTTTGGAPDTRPAPEPTTNLNKPIDSSTATAPALNPTTPAPATNTVPSSWTPAPAASPAPSPAVVNNPGAADQTKNADNTKINDRDRHGALTPMDQGNSGSETKITAAIRKGIMGDKTLSFVAKNVKVITVGSKVTLRGPVKSDQEKAAIEALAKQAAGVTEVDNQLEVKK